MKLKDMLIDLETPETNPFIDYGDPPEREYLAEFWNGYVMDHVMISARCMDEAKFCASQVQKHSLPTYELVNISEAV